MRPVTTAAVLSALFAMSAATPQGPATADPAASAFLQSEGSLLDIAMKNVEGADRLDDPAWRDGQCGPCLLDTLDRQTDPTLDSIVAECGERPASSGFANAPPNALRSRQVPGCGICGGPGNAATIGITKKPERRQKRTPQEKPTPISSALEPAPSDGDDANATAQPAAPAGKTSGGFERNTCKNPKDAAVKLSEAWDDRVPETEELRAKFDKVFGAVVEDEKKKQKKKKKKRGKQE